MKMQDIIDIWLREHTHHLKPVTLRSYECDCHRLSRLLSVFDPATVRGVDIYRALECLKRTPYAYNKAVTMVRHFMHIAIMSGLRNDDPTQYIRGAKIKQRDRYITDSELRRIKVAAIRQNGQRSRAGEVICCFIDLAYLTGQRLGDLVRLKWADLTPQGIRFCTSKTGAKICIEYTPRLRALIERIKRYKAGSEYLLSQTTGKPYANNTICWNWIAACKKAGVGDAHFHDIRAKALTDKYLREGIEQANAMGAHRTQWQTAHYIKRRKILVTSATQ